MAKSYPLQRLVAALEAAAPPGLAEPWDNVGLLCGEAEQSIERVLLCNDWDERVLGEAQADGSLRGLLIVAYHPPWFQPSKRLLGPSPLHAAISGGAAIYSLHTAFDAAQAGTNAALAEALGLVAPQPLLVAPAPHPSHLGQGRCGRLPAPVPLTKLVAAIKAALHVPHVLLVPTASTLASEAMAVRVAVAAGAGRSLLAAARQAGADVLVTGELPHHDALAARQSGLRVVALRHSVSERLALAPLAACLQACFAGIPVTCSQLDADPYVFA